VGVADGAGPFRHRHGASLPGRGASGYGGREELPAGDPDALVPLGQYVRGYWLTRCLEDARPGLPKCLLSQRYPHDELESQVPTAYGKQREEFWNEID